MYNSQGLQKLAKDVIYIFLSIVTSKKFNMRIELCFDHFFKVTKVVYACDLCFSGYNQVYFVKSSTNQI